MLERPLEGGVRLVSGKLGDGMSDASSALAATVMRMSLSR
jgi:hypothetical protein